MSRGTKTLILALAACIVVPSLVFACPLCKEAQPSNAVAGTDMWRGMYWSILLMIAVPFGVAASVIVAIVRARRRQVQVAQQGAAVPVSAPALPFPESGGART
jgi:heme/copper-type cytochrome/quinol oxidase subunit 2